MLKIKLWKHVRVCMWLESRDLWYKWTSLKVRLTTNHLQANCACCTIHASDLKYKRQKAHLHPSEISASGSLAETHWCTVGENIWKTGFLPMWWLLGHSDTCTNTANTSTIWCDIKLWHDKCMHYNPYLYTKHTTFFNMHQTMTAKDNLFRGTIQRINRQQHPPPRKVRFFFSKTGLTWGNEMCPRFLARKYFLSIHYFWG